MQQCNNMCTICGYSMPISPCKIFCMGQVPLTDEMAGLAPLYSICQCLVTLRAAMKLVCISCRLLCVTYEALSIIPNTKHFWGENF